MFSGKNYCMIEILCKRLLKANFIRNLPLPSSIKANLAFTLAEVLITLLIIGIVSSIAIPVLIQDTQNAELKVALKKSISVLSQANTRILTDNAGSLKNLCSGSFDNSVCFKNLFTPYLSVMKSCVNSASQGCWHKANNWYNYSKNTTSGVYAGILDNLENKTNYLPGYILNDGTFITFTLWDGTCQNNSFTKFPICGYISFDINGFKGPNTVGKDIFAVWIRQNRITPVGTDDVYVGLCETHLGWGCTAKYLK